MKKPSDEYSDENLAEFARGGDADAMDALLTRYKSVVLQCARRFFLTGGERDDLIQEGMIGLYRAVLRFDAERNPRFKSFASLCIKRQIIDAVRKNNSAKNYALNNCVPLDDLGTAPDFFGPEERVLSAEAYEELKAESKTLSRLERIIMEKYLEGKSYSEIAAEIRSGGEIKKNATEKSIDNAIQRIRKKLKG
ncbi:MAG: sigma-70 family RNA polymerase sigma factor [Clostridiales bacterium]|jgi:RNA polymerase sporulation-specific sigma factor|nr:sigma-70 family RNA polymerase sigma factor [Clostridiales bacterium]